ncbi:YafY family protein [Microbacterium pseudoresistens]|uniref:Proteasome accessory factor C n=1 Tax=Microbacterium pseudoresistens TaxID=640634 RepID=A0A7Y9JNK3_9MICO|nr:WYL domain-containing protein [Microbacterium pseudoresistens]NYD55420.1 proteasome accessory factor C [Microbacterium pseudoresistens]
MNARKPRLTSDRVRAFLTLVPYLLERGEVSVADAAADFDVTETEMRAMVQKLTVIGLPGDEGYWQAPQELFDINWDLLDDQGIIEITNDVGLRRAPRLTAREAAALLAGLQLAASLPTVADSGVVAGLIAKLSRGAAGLPADVIVAPGAVDEVRTLVSQGIRDGVAISFAYRAPDAEPTTRTVDPVKVLITNGQWYLQGWCHLRRAMRTFHLDRVSDPRLTEIPIEHGEEPVPELFAVGSTEGEATVVLPEALAPLVREYLEHGTADVVDGVLTARLRVADPVSLKRLAARFGGRLSVTAPAHARTATREWAAAGLALYNEQSASAAG